ncbi:MAG: M1 family metallopeptidase [Chitinophagaceae bacterium]|nr:M1 family metallopeptidase [Chitinophagaceae bacterium]
MRNICSILLCFFLFGQSFGQHNYWQQKVDYAINVKLNDVAHTLDGFIKINYSNQSPDTLTYIWFHVWPNAYKNDKTAFSEQLLENGNTSFYFSGQEERGYINQLDFRVNDIHAEVQDHPNDIDIVKLVLPAPLPPGQSILITTPFHVKLPYNFSRSGHIGQSYQIAQWYPKPAVYDSKGWHAMPYLDQGEFYGEFGNYEVTITLPENYAVAATGVLQDDKEKEWLKSRAAFSWKETKQRKKIKKGSYKIVRELFPASSAENKTLHYKQDNVVDFAWFADKRFVVDYDTCILSTGKVIDVYAFYTSKSKERWSNSVAAIKKALRNYSDAVGEYPYANASVVETDSKTIGGMEYPTVAAIAVKQAAQLNEIISHEVGHNWFYGILASNERIHPWMDEGINSYYDHRLINDTGKFSSQKLMKLAFETFAAVKKDQPIALSAPAYSLLNYGLSVYYKTSEWMRLLESKTGRAAFDTLMQQYYRQRKFKHPYPEDFRDIIKQHFVLNTDSLFNLLNTTGSLTPDPKRKFKVAFIGKPGAGKQYNYINIAPAIGFNLYDKFMIGAVVHNYSLPFRKFQFIAVPLYATGSKTINGVGRATYSWYPQNMFEKIEVGLSASKFSENTYTDSIGKTTYLQFKKITPQVRLVFNNNDPRSLAKKYIQFKLHYINQDALNFSWDSIGMKNTYAVSLKATTIGQLRYVTENSRALYPYKWELQIDMTKDFGRLAYTGNYFFNFPNKGGLNMRWFAGKFFYWGDKTSSKRFEADAYHLNMSTPKGYEDYTYSNYFIGRNEFEGFFSQQVMIRDGGFKVRTDLLSDKVGKTDDWLGALNFTATLHPKFPVKLFADMGTYSEAWKTSDASRLLFDAGLQVSLLKDIVNIYVPVIYSKVYRDYFRSYPGNNFWQRISFSIDIQNISFKKFYPAIPF